MQGTNEYWHETKKEENGTCKERNVMVEKLDIYYDHYKESVSLCQTTLLRRNKSFVYLCVLEAISFLLAKNPDFICSLLNEVVRKQLETKILFTNSVLQTLVWIFIAYVLIRYV